jgi:hypothetical protein
MQIDPNVKGIVNGVVAVCGVLSLIGVSAFPDYVPPGVAKDVVQTAGLIFTIYGGLNSGANFLSSSKPGALAPADPPVVVAAQKLADATMPGDVAQAKAQLSVAASQH